MEKLRKLKETNNMLPLIRILLIIIFLSIILYVIYAPNNCNDGRTIGRLLPDIQQIESINKSWIIYEGEKNGTEIKSLISRLMGNAHNYREETEFIVGSTYIEEDIIKEKIIYEEDNRDNDETVDRMIEKLRELYYIIQPSKMYNVSMGYNEYGLINMIIISEI